MLVRVFETLAIPAKGPTLLKKNALTAIAMLLVLAFALGVVGCESHDNRLVGTWAPTSSGLTWTFAADGSFMQTGSGTPGGLPNRSGTYTLSGNDLTMIVKSPQGSVTTTATVDFVSKDEVKVALGGMLPLTFSRKK
jgi:hypothetical protein